MPNEEKIRVSNEFKKDVIDWFRAKYLLDGKKPPSISKITRIISKWIDKEEIWQNEYAQK